MDLFLFAISGCSMVYYVILVLFTDAVWTTQLFWPVSAVVILVVGMLLHVDRIRKKQQKKGLPLALKTCICTTCFLYFGLVVVFTVLVLSGIFYESTEEVDYLVLAENADVELSLTEYDYNALNCAMEYMETHEDVKVVLAGSSRFRDLSEEDTQLQNLMKNYLVQQGVDEDRIITEEISNNLRQNITYSYAYILVDWYGADEERQNDPSIGIITDTASIYRYQTIIDQMGREMQIISFSDSLLLWPARIVEEISLILDNHFTSRFVYHVGS